MMKKGLQTVIWIGKILVGSAIFALAFDLFLETNGLNSGGVSGLAMVFVKLAGVGTVGSVTAVINLPLFAIGGLRIGKKFVLGSLIGMVSSSVLLDVFSKIPAPELDPLLCAIYGGVLAGLGLGIVFAVGASTGGSDIVVRLMKMRLQHIPIGMINMMFDLVVAILTGLAFQDISKTLYSGIAIFATGQVIDAVVYRFDYSKVAFIITGQYETVAEKIDSQLHRGVTFLDGQGFYLRKQTKVILTAVKKQQVAELKQIVVDVDPDAFIIVQEAHQVLGDGFSHYTKDSL